MSKPINIAIVVLVGATIVACARPGLNRLQSPCGDLILWRLPATLVTYQTPSDMRTREEIQTHARISLIKRAAEAQCRAQGGRYPETLAELASPSPEVLAVVGRCTVDPLTFYDGWEMPLEYRIREGQGVYIRSSGPDLQFGTADDIELPTRDSPFWTEFDIETTCKR